jgi:hypothetical protein
MPTPSMRDLEQAASEYFEVLMIDVIRPRPFDEEHFDQDVAINLEASSSRLEQLDHQLFQNVFDANVTHRAERLAKAVGGVWRGWRSPHV